MYLTDYPPSRYMTQGRFIVGSHGQIETHAQPIRKYFVLSEFPYWDSSTLQSRDSLAKRLD